MPTIIIILFVKGRKEARPAFLSIIPSDDILFGLGNWEERKETGKYHEWKGFEAKGNGIEDAKTRLFVAFRCLP